MEVGIGLEVIRINFYNFYEFYELYREREIKSEGEREISNFYLFYEFYE